MREPNTQVKNIPAGIPAPTEVREASAAMVEARARYQQLRDEASDHEGAISAAQRADLESTKQAIATGKTPPKPTLPAVVARGEALDREVEASREIAIEAEVAYVTAGRENRDEWASALEAQEGKLRSRERAALAELTQTQGERVAVEQALREVSRLLSPDEIGRDISKAAGREILDLRPVADTDRQIEKRAASIRKANAVRSRQVDTLDHLAAMRVDLEDEAEERTRRQRLERGRPR